MNKSRIYKKCYIWLIMLATVITVGIDLYTYPDATFSAISIQRQYGPTLKLNVLTLIILGGFLVFRVWRRSSSRKNIFFTFVLFAILSLVFPNGQDLGLSVIGIYMICKYALLYWTLISVFKYSDFKRCIESVFKGVLILESIGGILQVAFHLYIPFLTSRNVESYRMGMLRMTGTMPFSADFALLISFILLYFLVEYLFGKRKELIVYIIIALIDIWFAGSRTMVLGVAAIFAYLFLRKHKNNPMIAVLAFIGSAAIIGFFMTTSVYEKLFVNGADNFGLMLLTRLVHWITGFNIIKENLLLGVGLNNSVQYVIKNPSVIPTDIRSLEPMTFYYTNPVHNSLIVMFCELGIIGGIIYLRIFINPLLSSIRRIRNIKEMPNAILYRKDFYWVISELVLFLIYSLQGWGLLKEFSWIMIIIVIAFYKVLSDEIRNFRSLNIKNGTI